MPINNAHCYNCNEKLDLIDSEKVLRHEECPKCSVSLKCCKMCQFYDIHAYNECKEPSAERIVDKEKPNFCTYYRLAGGDQNQGPSKNDLLSAADALFKK